MRKNNLIGKRYGRLVVIDEAPNVRKKSGKSMVVWRCKCDCGNIIDVKADYLGCRTNSCGCIAYEWATSFNKTHGCTGTRLFNIWMDMKQRCNNANQPSYKNYGARGIKICKEWETNFVTFKDWAYKTGYKDELTIERIDVNSNYCPENCTWILPKEQAKNRRTSRMYTFNNETHCLNDWAVKLGINYWTLRGRLDDGWNVEKAFTTPIRHMNKEGEKKND